MRYAEYKANGGVAIERRPERRAVDLIREAARTDRYWVLSPEPAGTWTLRQLDGATGLLGDPAHESDVFGPDSDKALAWAGDLVEVTGWVSMSRPYPRAFVDEVYDLVRDLALTPRPGRTVIVRVEPGPDGIKLLVVRECWPATGLESDPLYSCECGGFKDEADMLRQVSGWFGLTEDGWTTVAPHMEYRHN
ncbi:hypothetical protein Drose_32280 [Dactylosporangium roseum]|uniref:Uncharacterized protein n=1 Tax=Dactylosporangium roseum TaxID=47989 RepID=A0ABY5Z249_9ACTN|nr:hypothetical protein [Dactylosporangium roseum]UWZ35734.1 hypothetical protein Drose_32280 [Dactylosporangium roseum]